MCVYIYTHIHVPIHIYMCVCVCVYKTEREGRKLFQVRDKSERVSRSVVSDSL